MRNRAHRSTGSRTTEAPSLTRPESSTIPQNASSGRVAFEELGVFYLGGEYDLDTKRRRGEPLLYDSKDLVTHAICIGMTGSGKTGLCLVLLEEALLDGIPALIIDPKGDLSNLLLTFPDLRAEDFAPWVNEEDAQRKGLSLDAYAAQQAALWQKGLAEWGQSAEWIRRLRASADFAIYTPGSTAGLPVSIMKSFSAPPPAIQQDADLFRDRISTTTTSLLGLLGIEGDPLRSREHILIATILDSGWRRGRSFSLQDLIREVQTPPVSQVGALALESFFPAKDRFAFATQLNNLLAAPGFGAWLDGEPLDVGKMLYTADGKPRATIFSIAHLSDAERMFFVALLLNETLGWVRTQSGTTSLRAIVYMDEIFGYFPPVANPPSKLPLLTLLKQARAFGVGVVLATQNPVDLDYKGLANTGTWFIGRLQTERDKARVLDGLEGSAAGSGQRFDRQQMTELLAGLGHRVFLMNNVHEDRPVVFETRWAMSYLRGPLTRDQIRKLMAGRKPSATVSAATSTTVTAQVPSGDGRTESVEASAVPLRVPAPTPTTQRPVLPSGVPQVFLPVRGDCPAGSRLLYRPMLLGLGSIRFVDPKARIDLVKQLAVVTPFSTDVAALDWSNVRSRDISSSDLEDSPQESAEWDDLPAAAAKPRSYENWNRELASWLYRTEKMDLFRHSGSGEFSKPGESERDFRIRLQEAARAERDSRLEALRKKFKPKKDMLEERLRRARQAEAREREQVSQQGFQAAISLGATILGAVLGRKSVSAGGIGRATTAARGAGRVLKERQDVARATETVAAVQEQIEDLERKVQEEVGEFQAKADRIAESLETVSVRPKKSYISIERCVLVWEPGWRNNQGHTSPAWV